MTKAARAASLIVACVATAACVDVFHSTDFGEALADAGAPDAGGASDAGADGSTAPIDFCAWSRAEARSHAVDVCARLAACELPFGEDAPGACIADAILAFDCTAAPNRKVKGAAHDAWSCFARATTCAALDACLFPAGPLPCVSTSSVDFASCAKSGSVATTRVDCPGNAQRPRGESCAARGQTCVARGTSESSCTGSQGITCVSGRGCVDTKIPDCDTTTQIDLGVDCASFGAGRCTSVNGSPACLAEGGSACTAATTIRCEGDVAVGCPSGVEERVDCAALGTGCNPSPSGGRDWDVARACTGLPEGGTSPCSADTCSADATQLVACVRGAPLTVTCADHGLGPCTTTPTVDGSRASCTPP